MTPYVERAMSALTDHGDTLDPESLRAHVATLVTHIRTVSETFLAVSQIVDDRDRAREALGLIDAVGCANSHVVKSYVDWGLGVTAEPTLTVPPPALVDWSGYGPEAMQGVIAAVSPLRGMDDQPQAGGS